MPNKSKPVVWPIRVFVENGQVRVSKDRQPINGARRDEISWSCDDGLLTIEFETADGCPFDKVKLPKDHPKHSPKRSGPVVIGDQKSYKYTAKVLEDGAQAPLELDPEVIVDDGTPPPPRPAPARKPKKKKKTTTPKKKKAAKKKAGKKKAARKAGRGKGAKKKAARRGGKKKAARRTTRRKSAKKAAGKRARRRGKR